MLPMSDNPGALDLSGLADLDRLVHEPARLSVMALLYVVESADFTFLMNQTGLTWGNLSTHLTKLEEAGYLEVEKSFKGRRPNTNLRLTAQGRVAFSEYARKMKQVFQNFSIL
jgi:DNA-binding MarR family transcriptional regulator